VEPRTADATQPAATRWRIDPDRSSIEFRTKLYYLLPIVKGRFSRYEGTLDLSAPPAIELTIEADSIDTANEKRDTHLRSPEFFDAAEHPYVRFVSQSVTLDGDRLQVSGRLHAAGHAMPLELEATLRQVGDELEVEAEAEVDHRQLGMIWKLGMPLSPSRLTVNGRLARDDT
jgi:polyisoprenoid-binding protein YceI